MGLPGGGFLFDSEEYNDGSDEPMPTPLHGMLLTQQQQSLRQQTYDTGDVDGGFGGGAFGFGDSSGADCSDSDSDGDGDGDGDARSSGTFKTTNARLGNRI